jgi:hypothetical protein
MERHERSAGIGKARGAWIEIQIEGLIEIGRPAECKALESHWGVSRTLFGHARVLEERIVTVLKWMARITWSRPPTDVVQAQGKVSRWMDRPSGYDQKGQGFGTAFLSSRVH